jgi:hypothetical protein
MIHNRMHVVRVLHLIWSWQGTVRVRLSERGLLGIEPCRRAHGIFCTNRRVLFVYICMVKWAKKSTRVFMRHGLSRNECMHMRQHNGSKNDESKRMLSQSRWKKVWFLYRHNIYISRAGKPCPSKLQHLLHINDCTPQQTLVDACAFHTSLPSTIPPLSSTNAKHVTTIIIQQYMYSPSSMTHYPLGVFFLASALTRRLYSACHAKNDCVIISR